MRRIAGMRGIAAMIAAAALAAGCASVDDVVARLQPLVRGDRIEVATFSRGGLDEEPARYWLPYIVMPSKPRTHYRIRKVDGTVALEARADHSASGLYRPMRIDLREHPLLEWSWKVEGLIPGADNRIAQKEDSPVRLILAFSGDLDKLDFFDRGKMRLAKALSGQELPYATLMYVWSNEHPVDTVIHNPHLSRIRMIVVDSGEARVGQWASYRRDVLADYRLAFEEEPDVVHTVGLMSDTDNTRTHARAWYGDITFRKRVPTAP